MWEKIVLNLVSNAFKFTFTGEIGVSLRERDGAARLTVRDTGIGIPASQIEKLFDRFHRVEGARGRSFEGSGIGLALVRELVKLHHGEIAVESEEGRGTAFHVTIPLGTAHLAPERVATEAGRSGGDFALAHFCRGGAALAARRRRRAAAGCGGGARLPQSVRRSSGGAPPRHAGRR